MKIVAKQWSHNGKPLDIWFIEKQSDTYPWEANRVFHPTIGWTSWDNALFLHLHFSTEQEALDIIKMIN